MKLPTVSWLKTEKNEFKNHRCYSKFVPEKEIQQKHIGDYNFPYILKMSYITFRWHSLIELS